MGEIAKIGETYFTMKRLWSEQRFPLEDDAQDLARINRYWEWLKQNNHNSCKPDVVARLPDYNLVVIKNSEEADFEAFYMNHSVGFNWIKYSQMGQIFSIRDTNNYPEATLLVRDKTVVHARSKNNEPINDRLFDIIDYFAKQLQWKMINRIEL